MVQVNATPSQQSCHLLKGDLPAIQLVVRGVVLVGCPGDHKLTVRHHLEVIIRLRGRDGRKEGRE